MWGSSRLHFAGADLLWAEQLLGVTTLRREAGPFPPDSAQDLHAARSPYGPKQPPIALRQQLHRNVESSHLNATWNSIEILHALLSRKIHVSETRLR